MTTTAVLDDEYYYENCFQSDILKDLNLFYIMDFNVLLCYHCLKCVNPIHAAAHVRLHHREFASDEQLTELQHLVNSPHGYFVPITDHPLNPLRMYFFPMAEPVDRIPFIKPIDNGIMCKLCTENICFSPSEKRMKTHIRTEHPFASGTYSQNVQLGVIIQKIFETVPKNGRKYFRVKFVEPVRQEQQAAAVDTHLFEKYKEIEAQDLNSSSSDPRDKSVWTNTLRWDILVGEFVKKDIFDIVSAHGDDDFYQKVYDLSLAYFNKIQRRQRDITIIIQRRIMQMAPEAIQKYFAPLQNPETVITYTKNYCRLLNSIIRVVREDTFKETFPKLRAPLERAVLKFCEKFGTDEIQYYFREMNLALWGHTFDGTEMNENDCPVIRFLAFVSLSQDGTFKPANKLTSLFSKIQYWARTVIFDYITESFYSVGNEEAEIRTLEYLKFVKEGVHTPFGRLREIIHLATYVAHSIFAQPNMDWIKGTNQRAMMVNGQILSIDDIARAAHSVVEKADQIIQSITFNLDLSNFNINALKYDDLSSQVNCFSFLTDNRNGMKQIIKASLGNIQNSAQFRNSIMFVDPITNAKRYNPVGIHSWFENVAVFFRYLIFLIHVTSGQPARGPELTTYKIRNDENGMRSVYYLMDTLMLLTSYWKGSNIWKTDKPIGRFLPKMVASLLLEYLVVIRPLEKILAKEALKLRIRPFNVETMYAYSRYLFVANGKRVDSRNIKTWFKQVFIDETAITLTFSQYRHIAQGFVNAHIIGKESQESRSDSFIEDLQAGRSTAVSTSTYGLMSSTFHPSLDRDTRFAFFMVSAKWHALLGMSEEMDLVENMSSLSITQQPRQPTSITHVAPAPVITQIITTIGETKRIILEPTKIQAVSVSKQLIRTMRQLLNNYTAEFRSPYQAVACEMALKATKDFICILPTGGGKTMLILLPAIIETEQNCTLVVVPLIALIKEMVERCEAADLDVYQWIPSTARGSINFERPPEIICVAVEHIDNSFFLDQMRKLKGINKLKRIFFDEAHLAIASESFRPVMRNVVFLRTLGVPIILLSATIPPSMVHELEIRFASKYSVIRDSTVRKNLGYVVKRFDAKYTTRNTMKANIIQQINLAAIQERLILFCRSIAMVNEFQDLFNSLNPSIYHSDLTDEQRQENVDSWKSGASKLIIATSGFGAGVDYSNVKYVHHWEGPHSMLDYAQECGRAGRSGSVAYCMMWTYNAFLESKRGIDENVLDFLISTSDKCIRQSVHEYLDHASFNCFALGSNTEECSYCLNENGQSTVTHTTTTLEHRPTASTSMIEPELQTSRKRTLSIAASDTVQTQSIITSSMRTQTHVNNALMMVQKVAEFLTNFNLCPVCYSRLDIGPNDKICAPDDDPTTFYSKHAACVKCIQVMSRSQPHNCPLRENVQFYKGQFICSSCALPEVFKFQNEQVELHEKEMVAKNCTGIGRQKSIPLCLAYFNQNRVSPNESITTLFEFKTWLFGRYDEMVPNAVLYIYRYVIPKRRN